MAEKITFDAHDLAEEHRLGASRVFCVVYSGQRSSVVELPVPTVLSIGRSPTSDVVLDDDRVSRRHARIESTPDGLRLRDLGSRNGSRVNGKRVEGARHLRSGDEIAIGNATLVVGITSAGFAGELRVLGHTAFEDRLAVEVQRAQCFDR